MDSGIKLGLIGAGSMGGSLFKAWVSGSILDAKDSAVFDPNPSEEIANLCREHQIKINPDLSEVAPDILVIAVKPQIAPDVLSAYRRYTREAAFLSVMAGKSIASMKILLGDDARLIRAMPNLPAAIGEGISGLFADSDATADDRKSSETLMNAAGASVWVDDEKQIDLVTAISGSGPAYVFLLVEALAEAGEKLGLAAEVAQKLSRQMVVGAGAYLKSERADAASLRKAVTSPGGTTAAALSVLNGDRRALRNLMLDAVTAAAVRAQELSD